MERREFQFSNVVMEHLMSRSDVVFSVVDKNGRIEVSNTAFERLVGRKEVCTLDDFLEEKDIAIVNDAWKKAQEGTEKSFTGQAVALRIRDSKGLLKPVKAWLYPSPTSLLLFGEPVIEEVGKYKGAYLQVVSEIDRINRENQQLKESAESLRKKLEQIEITDVLTGVSNRKYFMTIMDTEWSRALRYEHPFSIIAFDIDRLKEVNEIYGPDTGDTVIVESVKKVRENLRMSDTIGRYEGGTFLVLLPETNAKRAYPMAERMRILTQGQFFFALEKTFQVTASFGITEAFCVAEDNSEKLLQRGLSALKKAKSIGKNRIELILY